MFDDLDPALALLSGRLLLRRPRLEDAPAVARLANDRKIAENTATIPHPYGLADAEAFVLKARGERKGVPFAVFRQEDGVLVGAGGVSSREREDAPEIGYWIGAPTAATAMPPRSCAPWSTSCSRNSSPSASRRAAG